MDEIVLDVIQVSSASTPEDGLEAVMELAERGSGEVALLPENWLGSKPVDVSAYLEAARRLSRLYEMAFAGVQYVVDVHGYVRSLGVAVAGGGYTVVCEKVFPSRAVGERGFLEPGSIRQPAVYKGWRIACIACVDIFYPELARIHSLLHGAGLLLNPSKIPADRIGLWRSALLTRAAENTVYVAGANSTGGIYRDGRPVAGGSAVYTPDGRLLAEAGDSETVLTATLKPEALITARSRWAFMDDAERSFKPLYSSILGASRIKVLEAQENLGVERGEGRGGERRRRQ